MPAEANYLAASNNGTMLDKLEAIKAKFDDLGIALTNPAIVSDNKRFGAMSKEYRSLEKIVLSLIHI